ncbi:ubiquitin carboxyl-terminal hydrolase 19-like isoform X1 [Lytechinus pictus]|uniref:ubiquitin carboxyl-terminal hydrolase 19-like isoform X1 n=1 Tax=Lytechinus pictus TaxID=7653 RepID=UPI0030BA25DB
MGATDVDDVKFEYEWRQTDEDIYVEFNVNGLEIKKEDIELELNDSSKICVCCVYFKDGIKWVCSLQHLVVKSSDSVKLKDGVLIVHLPKKEKFKEWKRLGDCAFTKEMQEEGIPNVINENGIQTEGSSVVRDGEGGMQMDEEKDAEEEYLVNHVKHNFFQRQDLKVIYLHMYVKKIKRDSVSVTFSENEICIKFKTNDNQFLQLNHGSTSDTLFCWRIRPWRPVVPAACHHKVTKSNLEVNITQLKAERWKALECSTKDTGNTPRGRAASQGDWVPLSSTKTATPTKESAEITKDSGSEKENLRGAVGGAKSVEIKESVTRTKSVLQKPTCTVPPLSLGKQAPSLPVEPTPSLHLGYCGLDNLGNTCFMNSVLQVLANTIELKDFMLGADFKNEINRDNPLGSGGHLVLSFAVLMRRLWGGQNKSIAPSKLKSIISAKASQFMGFAQHDAQEFMAFLLDGLHEDINRIRKKPYTQTVDSDGRPDEVVADEAWKTHRRRNDSFIVDLFQGQYKSKLVCPDCNKVSITFDPFMHLSMPLPKKKRHFPVYFFSRDCHQRPVKYVVSLSSDATVHELTVQVGQMAGVNAANLRVFEVHRSCIQKVFSRRSTMSGVSFNDIIFVHEVLSPSLAGESVVELSVIQRMLMPPALLHCSHCKKSCEKSRSLKRCTKCYRAAYCDQACQKSNWNIHRTSCRRFPEPVGCPFIISLPKSHATYARLCQLMECYARYSTNVFVPPLKSPGSISSSSSSSSHESEHPSTSTHSPPHSQGLAPPSTTTSPVNTPRIPTRDDDEEMEDREDGKEKMNDSGIEDPIHSKDMGDASIEGTTDRDEALRKGDEGGGGDTGEESIGHFSDMEGAATATVVGQPQTLERKMPLFFIKPVNHIGNSIPSKERFKDEGDVPLDLTGIISVAMDWRNDPKQENNVLVESRTLDYNEDESVCGVKSYEETEITLDQCLKLFTEPEKLSPEEAWYCPKCKQHREATKQMLLWRLPSTLIIQLKRFSFGNMLWRDKIDKMVEYPVRGLDLSPYCHGTHSQPLIYDLYGVINHHGGILGGHYTSIARLASTADWSKNEHDWRLFDDSHVTTISEKNVVTRSAYLLFYRRRQPYTPYIWQPTPEPEVEPMMEGKSVKETVDEPEDMDDK